MNECVTGVKNPSVHIAHPRIGTTSTYIGQLYKSLGLNIRGSFLFREPTFELVNNYI